VQLALCWKELTTMGAKFLCFKKTGIMMPAQNPGFLIRPHYGKVLRLAAKDYTFDPTIYIPHIGQW
jgi:hypothetical protein